MRTTIPALLAAVMLALTGCAAPQSVTSSTPPAGAPESSPAESGTGEEGSNTTKVGTWAKAEDGLMFRVSKLAKAKVGAYAAGGKPGGPAVVVTVQFRNEGATRFDTSLIQVAARLGGEGAESEQVFDSEHGYGDGFTGTVSQGRSATQKFMFAAESAGDLKTVSVEVTPSFDHDSFTFEGSV